MMYAVYHPAQSILSPSLYFFIVQIQNVYLTPTSFMGTKAITTDLGNCEQTRHRGISCFATTVLNNNDGSLQPNFPSDTNKFVAWTVSSPNELTLVPNIKPSIVSSIEIYFYNNPRQGFGWPTFLLVGLSDEINGRSLSDPLLNYDLINNSQLSQNDQRVHIVTLRIQSPNSYRAYLIQWNFDHLINVTWLAISEVVLCNDMLENQTTSISFSNPSADNTVITAQSEQLSNAALTLTCSVSSDGNFVWTWRKDNMTLRSLANGIKVQFGDATRTSVLTVPVPSTNSFYYCDVARASFEDNYTRSFEVIVVDQTSKSVVYSHCQVILTWKIKMVLDFIMKKNSNFQ